MGKSTCKVSLACYRKEPESTVSQGRKKDSPQNFFHLGKLIPDALFWQSLTGSSTE